MTILPPEQAVKPAALPSSKSAINVRYLVPVLIALTVIALLVRLYRLMDWPVFMDEGVDILWSMEMIEAGHFPLTGIDSYNGPLFSYLVVAGYSLFGSSAVLPRAMVAVAGALTVLPTFWLGRSISGVSIGLLAATGVAFSPTLVTEISHYGWTAGLTPLFMTTALALIAYGLQGGRDRFLVIGGLCLGLAIQTHPTSAAIVPGVVAVTFWITRKRGFRVLLLLVGMIVIGYLPNILATMGFGRPALEDANNRTYAFGPTLDVQVYVSRLSVFARGLANVISGRQINQPWLSMIYPSILAVCIVAGIWLLVRARHLLIPVVFVSLTAIMPVIMLIFTQRYLAWIVPALFVPISIGLIWLLRVGTRPLSTVIWGRVVQVATVVMLLIGVPLVIMIQHYRLTDQRGYINTEFFNIVRMVTASGLCGPNLIVFGERMLTGQSWFQANVVHYLLQVDGCNHDWLVGPADQLAGRHGAWVLTSWPVPNVDGHTLTPLFVFHPPRIQLHWTPIPFGLFQME